MGQEALCSEGGRTEKLEQETNAFDRSEQLLDAPAGDAVAVANRIDSDGQALPNGLGPRCPAACGVGFDFADESGRNPRRDPLERGLDDGGVGLRSGRGTAWVPTLCLASLDPVRSHRALMNRQTAADLREGKRCAVVV